MRTEFAKVKDAFHKLNVILTKEQKGYSMVVFFMSLISAIFEMLGVTLLIPLLNAFLDPETLAEKSYIAPFVKMFHLQNTQQIILFLCVVMIVLYLLKNLYGVFYIWVSARFSCKIMRELSARTMKTYMKQGYSFFVANNSARLLRGLEQDVNSVYVIISNLFGLFNKGLTLLCLTALIIAATPQLAFFLMALVLICFALVQLIFRKPMQKYGQKAREYNYLCGLASIEAIQGSKEVLVTNRQSYFVKQYEKCMAGANRATVKISVGQTAPNYIIEAVCIAGLMGAVIFQTFVAENALELLRQLALLAVAAFRILPTVGGIMGSVNVCIYHAPSLEAAYETLCLVQDLEKNRSNWVEKKERPDLCHVGFEKELHLSHITFVYESRDLKVIDDLSMTIKKGTSVAFIGGSGAGKTTLADIILALLKPQNGQILMDGIDVEELGGRWNQIVGYVPQSIYMTDSTVRRNIAFGIDESEIDDEKVWAALEMAQMKEFVEKLPLGLEALVGEWGVQFSGGQRQRIAIARALYGNPDILILDEATASLDTDTETAVMEAIDALQGIKTLIIVAHRLTTIRNCDKIYEIKDGKAIEKQKEEIFAEI
mgnify:CR=1 FL=1